MKTYMTVSEMTKHLQINSADYERFRAWCYRHRNKLDTQQCKWNNGYTLYNVKIVSELYKKKHAAPATTPLEAAERLALALNAVTGRKDTGTDVLAAFERGKDYIRMRRTMARVLWRVRKERRVCNMNRNACRIYSCNCYSAYGAFDTRMKKLEALESKENIAAHAAVVTMILFILVSIAFLTHVFCS